MLRTHIDVDTSDSIVVEVDDWTPNWFASVVSLVVFDLINENGEEKWQDRHQNASEKDSRNLFRPIFCLLNLNIILTLSNMSTESERAEREGEDKSK